MTLITLSYKKSDIDINSNGIVCFADSLASNTTNPEMAITEQAMKIVSLSCCYEISFKEYPQLHHNEIGIAFAGNISIAMQTYNIARIACRHIQPTPNSLPNNCPSIHSIATLIAQILEYYYKKYAFLILESAKTEMVVFGFCYRNKKFVAYHLKPEIIENSARIIVEDTDITNISYFSFGSGAKDFNDYVKENPSNNLQTNFRNFIKSDIAKKKGVGGYVQKCFVNFGYFFYFMDVDSETLDIRQGQIGGFTFNNCFLDDYIVLFPMHPWL